MTKVIFAFVAAAILICIVAFLFWRLKSVKANTILIYSFLLVFTIAMYAITKDIKRHHDYQPWLMPISLALFQFAQVMVRLPLGKLSQKLRSRKWPIILALVAMFTGALLVMASDFAAWSIPIGFMLLGVFGATFGIHNQYISESWDIKQGFLSVAIVATLPSLANFITDGVLGVVSLEGIKFHGVENALMWVTLICVVISLLYVGMRENKDALAINNMIGENASVAALKLRDVLIMSATVVFISVAVHMVQPLALNEEITSSNIRSKVSVIPLVVNAIAVAVALLTSFVIIRLIEVHIVALFSNIILLLTFIFGIVLAFVHSNWELWLIFMVFLTIGFSLFQTTMLGTMLHFDHKNPYLVLGIWLTIRSFSSGVGIAIGEEVVAYHSAIEAAKWIIPIAAVLVVISILYIVFRYNSGTKVVFDSVIKHEHSKFRQISETIWRDIKKL